MLTADNDFIKTWIEKHYASYIKQALREIYGIDYTVAIEVDINQEVPDQPAAAEPTPVEEQPTPKKMAVEPTPVPVESYEKPSHIQTFEDSPLSHTSTLTFENFVIGESNRMAYSMAVAVAEEPGR